MPLTDLFRGILLPKSVKWAFCENLRRVKDPFWLCWNTTLGIAMKAFGRSEHAILTRALSGRLQISPCSWQLPGPVSDSPPLCAMSSIRLGGPRAGKLGEVAVYCMASARPAEETFQLSLPSCVEELGSTAILKVQM